MDICYCLDDNFADYAAVSIKSAILSMESTSTYTFHIGYTSLSETSKDIIKSQLNDKCKIIFYQLDRDEFKNYRCGVGDITEAASYRLIMPNIIENVDRLLYIDCDTLVLNDVSKLSSFDMEDYAIAAVLDLCYTNHIAKTGNNTYFNSGVLLIDCKKWKEMDMFVKVRNALNCSGNTLPDQDALNRVFANAHALLPIRYNTMVMHNHAFSKYTGSDAILYKRATNNPTILHFIGKTKPWKLSYAMKDIIPLYNKFAKLANIDKSKYNIYDNDVFEAPPKSKKSLPHSIYIDANGNAYDKDTMLKI